MPANSLGAVLEAVVREARAAGVLAALQGGPFHARKRRSADEARTERAPRTISGGRGKGRKGCSRAGVMDESPIVRSETPGSVAFKCTWAFPQVVCIFCAKALPVSTPPREQAILTAAAAASVPSPFCLGLV